MSKIYLILSNRYCDYDDDKKCWSIKLPEQFYHCVKSDRYIKVTNFDKEESLTSFHSPTICDANYNQNYYICSNVNTFIPKIYHIESRPQTLEFWLEDIYTGEKISRDEPFLVELELMF